MARSDIDPEKLYWALTNAGELRLPGEAVIDLSASGQVADAADYWAPKIKEQCDKDNFANRPTAESIRNDLRDAGAWDEEELADDAANWLRFIWGCACSIAEEDEPDCSEPVAQLERVIGAEYTFDYPAEFVTLPEYTAHAGQRVIVIRQLNENEAQQDVQPMYEVKASDGWVGHAWAEELI